MTSPDISDHSVSNFVGLVDTLVYPKISETTAKELEPKMKRWLDQLDVKISAFRQLQFFESEGWDWDRDEQSLYFRPYDLDSDEVYEPRLRDYSPNKEMFVNVVESRGAFLENDTLKYYGGDDCQEIYLTNRRLKKCLLLLWLGTGGVVEDCFWLNDTSFVLVGRSFSGDYIGPIFYLYNSKDQSNGIYFINDPAKIEVEYLESVNLRSRGCPVLND